MTQAEQVPLVRVLTQVGSTVALRPDENYRVAGIYSFGKGLFEREPIRGSDTSYETLVRLEADQFVVSKLNGWEGAVDVVSPDIAGCHVSAEYPVFAINRDKAEPAYLRWIARWPTFWDRLVPRGSMVRRKRVRVSQLLDVTIPLPPIDEQRRVAARLDGIRFVADQVAILARHAEAVRAAFVPSAAGAPHEPQADKLARGWCWTELRSVMVRSAQRVTVNPDGSYPNLGICGFGRGVFSKPPIEGDRTSAKTLYRVRAGQFIYSRLFAFEGAYATVPDEFDGHFVSNEFPSFDADAERLDPEWLASYLRSPERWAELAASSVGLGVRRQRVPVDALLDYRVLLPPIEEQRQAVESISRISQAAAKSARALGHAAAVVPASLNHEFASLRRRPATNRTH